MRSRLVGIALVLPLIGWAALAVIGTCDLDFAARIFSMAFRE